MRLLYIFDDETAGALRPASVDEILAIAKEVLSEKYPRGAVLESPGAIEELCRVRLADLEHEIFAVLWLDNRNRLIEFEELFRGTIDGASVHAREVVKSGLYTNAAACVLTHCHPSGVAEPSASDEAITKRLREALALIDVRVLDHVIVAAEGSVSFAERGLI